MAHEEKHGRRDLTYSAWHRRMSTQRYIGLEQAERLTMIDGDCIEYDNASKKSVALVETALDVGQSVKPATVMQQLARDADVPCYVLLYTPSDDRNPADPRFQDIGEFRFQLRHPQASKDWVRCSPEEWCRHLLSLRKARQDDMAEFWNSLGPA